MNNKKRKLFSLSWLTGVDFLRFRGKNTHTHTHTHTENLAFDWS